MSKSDFINEHNATSGGHMSEAQYLDDHFEAMRPEYERLVKSVGIESGWRVLDAGCGGGSFLTILDELVGNSGYIMATDLATENVERVWQRVNHGEFSCELEARQMNVTALSFADSSFDAVWCAAVTQYLSDDEVWKAFSEFKRVVKPGGLIAIKEGDFTSFHLGPFPSEVIWRSFIEDLHGTSRGVLRAPGFAKMFRELGLVNVSSKTILAERQQPLRKVERRFIGKVLSFMSALYAQLDLPEEDKRHWRGLGNLDDPQHILNDPNFFYREPHNLTIGRLPVN